MRIRIPWREGRPEAEVSGAKGHIPVRMCMVCGKRGPKEGLLRLFRSPEGRIFEDPGGGTPGRGAYVCREGACLGRLNERHLARAFRGKVPCRDVRRTGELS